MKINFLVNTTDFHVETDAKGVATYMSENGSAFPATYLFAYQVVDPSGSFNTYVRQTTIPPPKIMFIEVRMVEKLRLNVTVLDKNTSSRAYNQRFQLYQGNYYYGSIETNVQGIFSIISGQNGFNFTMGTQVRLVAEDQVMYKDKTCAFVIKYADQAVECVMEQHPMLTLTVNTYGSASTKVQIFSQTSPIF